MSKELAHGSELYVWYRCDTRQLEAVTSQGQGLLERIATRCGISGRLLLRREAGTLMEHFCVPAARRADFEAALAEQQALLPTDFPARHAEWFEPWP